MAHNRIVDQSLAALVEAAGRDETAEQSEVAALYILARLRDLQHQARQRLAPATRQGRRRSWYLATEGPARPTIVE